MGKGQLRFTAVCPICKQTYVYTNWMIRKEPGYHGPGYQKTDTHILACRKKLAMQKSKAE